VFVDIGNTLLCIVELVEIGIKGIASIYHMAHMFMSALLYGA